MKRLWAAMVAVFFLSLSGCSWLSGGFQQKTDLSADGWRSNEELQFNIPISADQQKQDVHLFVRCEDGYSYSNLYVLYVLKGPDGREVKRRLLNLPLYDATTGRPLGSGTGGINDVTILGVHDEVFAKPGTYTLSIRQYMRDNPLKGIQSLGVHVHNR